MSDDERVTKPFKFVTGKETLRDCRGTGGNNRMIANTVSSWYATMPPNDPNSIRVATDGFACDIHGHTSRSAWTSVE